MFQLHKSSRFLALSALFLLVACESKPDEVAELATTSVSAATTTATKVDEAEEADPGAILAEARGIWANDNHSEAIALLESANSNDPELLNELGYMAFKTDQFDKAWKSLQKAKSSISDETTDKVRARIAYNTALVAEEKGDKEAALAAIEEANELNPGKAVSRAMARIRGAEPFDCASSEKVVELTKKSDKAYGEGLTWKSDDVQNPPPGEEVWKGDLNGDSLEDKIVNHKQHSPYGESMYAIYAGCEDGKHAVLFYKYAQHLKVLDEKHSAHGMEWATIEQGMRNTSKTPSKQFYTRKLEMSGGAYTPPK